MEVHQIKPEYTKIVAAIPHSVSKASYWQWQDDESSKKASNRWTDALSATWSDWKAKATAFAALYAKATSLTKVGSGC